MYTYRRRELSVFSAIMAALILLQIVVTSTVALKPTTVQAQPLLNSMDRASQRILVFAPHPDDESLGVAGLAQEFLKAGSDVWIVLATNGDANVGSAKTWFNTSTLSSTQWIEYGKVRQAEAKAAAAHIGIPEDHVIFLSYPDSGIDDLWGSNWSGQNPWRSPFTQSDHSPYSLSYTSEASYTGEAALQDFIRVFEQVKPTLAFLPHAADTHQDHWSTGAFASAALEALRMADNEWAQNAQVLEYLVHWNNWPWPSGVGINLSLSVPQGLESTCAWQHMPISETHRSQKSRAISAHKSQAPNTSALSYLLSFSRAHEVFAVCAPLRIPAALEDQAVMVVPDSANSKTGTPLAISFSRHGPDNIAIELELRSNPPSGSHWDFRFYGIAPQSAETGNVAITRLRVWPQQAAHVEVMGLNTNLTEVPPVKSQVSVASRNSTLQLQLPLVPLLTDVFLFSVETYHNDQLVHRTPFRVIHAH